MKRIPQVSITKQRIAYKKTNGICVICGKRLSADENTWSVDHFIPRAIYKWIKDDEEARSIIESEKNIFVVHSYCNFAKDSSLPTNRNIDSMHAPESVKNSVRELYRRTEESVNKYRAIKQSTIDSQGRKCAMCGKKLELNDATLRRIDNKRGRNRENAMCLCDECNRLAGNPNYKKRMVKKKNIQAQ